MRKTLYFIGFVILVTIVAAVLQKPGQTIPPVSNAILIVGAIFGVIYLVVKLVKKILFKPKK